MDVLSTANGEDSQASCAIYARVASIQQAESSNPIDLQLEAARKYATGRGWTILREYVDAGASGTGTKGRPQFTAMIDEALTPNPPFTVILVYDHSRFYRNIEQSEVTRAALRRNGVEVLFLIEPKPVATPGFIRLLSEQLFDLSRAKGRKS